MPDCHIRTCLLIQLLFFFQCCGLASKCYQKYGNFGFSVLLFFKCFHRIQRASAEIIRSLISLYWYHLKAVQQRTSLIFYYCKICNTLYLDLIQFFPIHKKYLPTLKRKHSRWHCLGNLNRGQRLTEQVQEKLCFVKMSGKMPQSFICCC